MKWCKNRCYFESGPYKGKPSRGLMKTIYKKKLLKTVTWPRNKTATHKKYRRPRQHGKAVDRALARWVTNPIKYHSRISGVKTFIKVCQDRHWTPRYAQRVVLGRPDTRIATCVDLVLQTASGEWLVVEVKTGYHDNIRERKIPLPSPWSMPNSQRAQHCVQAILGAEMYARTYKVQCRPIVVYIRDENLPEIVETMPDIDIERVWDRLVDKTPVQSK